MTRHYSVAPKLKFLNLALILLFSNSRDLAERADLVMAEVMRDCTLIQLSVLHLYVIIIESSRPVKAHYSLSFRSHLRKEGKSSHAQSCANFLQAIPSYPESSPMKCCHHGKGDALLGQVPDPSSHCQYIVEAEFDFASDSTLSCRFHRAEREQTLVS